MKILRACLLSSAAVATISSAALAADLGGSIKDAPITHDDWKIVATGGATTDYVFRGVSQNNNDPSVNASITVSYKMFYLGFSAEAVDQATTCGGNHCSMEADVVGGIKHSYAGFDFDFGFIYYGYTNQQSGTLAADFWELKASASRTILKDLTLTGTVYWSPNYTAEAGSTWTFEGTISKPLPIWGIVASGTVGYVTSEDKDFHLSGGINSDNYTYWNAGLAKTFREHYTFDVRYWGTDIDNHSLAGFISGDRVVGSFTFNY